MKVKNRSIALTFVIALLTITGCNTIEGAGQDLQKAGESIENAANKNDPE